MLTVRDRHVNRLLAECRKAMAAHQKLCAVEEGLDDRFEAVGERLERVDAAIRAELDRRGVRYLDAYALRGQLVINGFAGRVDIRAPYAAGFRALVRAGADVFAALNAVDNCEVRR